jgi:hypothetical protein
MSDAIFLPFDTETGGIGPEMSLLSAHFAVCDEDWNILDELDLNIKPNDGIYRVTAEGLSVNKINLVEHEKVAVTYSLAGSQLRDFLVRNSQNGRIKLQPMGKNVGFDVKKVTDNILGVKTFNQFVSYRCYDITPIVTFLKRTGRLDRFAPESLEGLAKFFGFEAEWHTARGDNLVGIKVIKRLEEL